MYLLQSPPLRRSGTAPDALLRRADARAHIRPLRLHSTQALPKDEMDRLLGVRLLHRVHLEVGKKNRTATTRSVGSHMALSMTVTDH